jgi:hypothetical protein
MIQVDSSRKGFSCDEGSRKVQGVPNIEKCALGSSLGRSHEKACSGGSACAEGGGGENGLKVFFPIPAMPLCGLCYCSVASHYSKVKKPVVNGTDTWSHACRSGKVTETVARETSTLISARTAGIVGGSSMRLIARFN